MERHYFMRGELSRIQSRVLDIAMTPGTNQSWVRAYYRLADALNNLEAYIAYEESVGDKYTLPEEPLKDINPHEPDDLKYIADICVRHNAIISMTGEDIRSTFYDEIRVAARILTFFNIRSCGGFKPELKNEVLTPNDDESSSTPADSVEDDVINKDYETIKQQLCIVRPEFNGDQAPLNVVIKDVANAILDAAENMRKKINQLEWDLELAKFGGNIQTVTEHLQSGGLASRLSWNNKCAVFFGMDNSLWIANAESRRLYSFCLADFKAEDWLKLPYNYQIEGELPFKVRG